MLGLRMIPCLLCPSPTAPPAPKAHPPIPPPRHPFMFYTFLSCPTSWNITNLGRVTELPRRIFVRRAARRRAVTWRPSPNAHAHLRAPVLFMASPPVCRRAPVASARRHSRAWVVSLLLLRAAVTRTAPHLFPLPPVAIFSTFLLPLPFTLPPNPVRCLAQRNPTPHAPPPLPACPHHYLPQPPPPPPCPHHTTGRHLP